MVQLIEPLPCYPYVRAIGARGSTVKNDIKFAEAGADVCRKIDRARLSASKAKTGDYRFKD